jgi:hypothetical protein
MKYARLFLFFFIFTFALTMGKFAGADEVKCPLCGAKLEGNENTDYQITFTDGKTVSYGCPHCGLWEHAKKKDKIKSARARDFISGEWMDVSKMYMLSHSDAVPACSDNWIGFGKKAEAEKFQKGFGGKIYTFEDALEEREANNHQGISNCLYKPNST